MMANRKRPTEGCPACHGEAQLAVRRHLKPCVRITGKYWDDENQCECPIEIVDCETCRGTGRMSLKGAVYKARGGLAPIPFQGY